VTVSWRPPPNTPTSYNVFRTDNTSQPVVPGLSGGATEAIVSDQLVLGQEISFRVEAVYDGAPGYLSEPSNSVVAFDQPGSPTIRLELLARSPTQLTVRVTVEVGSTGGSPVTSYDLSVGATGSGTQNFTGSIDQNQRDVRVDCAGSPTEICLGGGTVTATASVANAAGSGPRGTQSRAIPGPPGFAYGQYYMYVSTGGKCLDVDLRLHTCTGSDSQLWVHNNTGDIRNRGNGNCLAYNDTLHFASDGCSEREKRWNRVNETGNQAQIRGQYGDQECVFVASPAAEGAQATDSRQCPNDAQDRWTAWRPQDGVPLTAASAAQPAAFIPSTADNRRDGPLGAATVALLLLPLAAGLWRRRQRRRNAG
jgi:hypothetical protein